MSTEDASQIPASKAAKPARKPAKAVKPKAVPANQPVSDAVAAEPVAAVAPPATPVVAETAIAPKDDEGRKDKKKKKAKKKEKKRKDAVIIRFDNDQLTQIDARAEALGLSRAAWVRMVVAKALS